MNSCSEYTPEELFPIVADLAKRYAGNESTSVSYDTMQNLMEAVLYCIHETGNRTVNETDRKFCRESGEKDDAVSSALSSAMTAKNAYDIGYRLVRRNVRDALNLYNHIETYFDDYGMLCLRDTMQKGMPEFFRRYDPLFHPQETLLLLDYPVPGYDRSLEGIDAIYSYLVCIEKEQTELLKYSREYVISKLRTYHRRYDLLIESVSELLKFR